MEDFYMEWQGDIGGEETVYMEDVEEAEDADVAEGAEVTGEDAAGEAGGARRKDRKLPFGLQTEDIPGVGQLVADHPGIADAMQQLLAAPLAASTMKGYDGAVHKFQKFCEEHGYDYTEPTEKIMMHYLADLHEKKASLAILCQVKPAVQLLVDINGRGQEAFTSRVLRMLEAAKRKAAEVKEPVRKAGEVSLELLKDMVEKHIKPYEEDIFTINVYWLRTITRLVVEYFTYCRFSDYKQLLAKDVEDKGDSVCITFPKSKNDQFHKGSSTVLAENGQVLCPVRLLRVYFKRFGLQFGAESGDRTPLHFRIRKVGCIYYADKGHLASESLAREELQALLRDMGVKAAGVTDKSFKMLGVTETLQAGVSVQEVALHGRWRTAEMPLRYKHNSDKYKKEVASKIPH